MLEGYQKTIHIEALTMIDIIKKEILPASIAYQSELVSLINGKKLCGIEYEPEKALALKLSTLTVALYKKLEELENVLINEKSIEDSLESAKYYRNSVFMKVTELRLIIDELETIVAKKHWNLPTYADILYSVN